MLIIIHLVLLLEPSVVSHSSYWKGAAKESLVDSLFPHTLVQVREIPASFPKLNFQIRSQEVLMEKKNRGKVGSQVRTAANHGEKNMFTQNHREKIRFCTSQYKSKDFLKVGEYPLRGYIGSLRKQSFPNLTILLLTKCPQMQIRGSFSSPL